ncbi:MAG TPA: hypothetical protein PKK59_08455 [Anaerolineaceae bacterium]|nr:hypothetical protein [Anaerolineaceae bacterium]
MADLRCLICNRVNDASAERCWYCRSPLPVSSDTPASDAQEKIPPSFSDANEELRTGEKPPDDAIEQSEEEVPEWLARIRELKAQEEQVSRQGSDRGPGADQPPEWLPNLSRGELDSIEKDQVQKALIEDQESGENASAETSFRDSVARPVTGEGVAAKDIEAFGDPGAADTTHPKSAAQGEQAAEDEAKKIVEPVFPIPVDDLPDWLSEEPDLIEKITSKAQKLATTAPPHDEDELEKGALPAWLKTLRPLEAVVPAASEQEIPSSTDQEGVLAGISGTLRSIDLEGRQINPALNPHDLVVTPAQQANVDLLNDLIHPASSTSLTQPVLNKKMGGKKFLKAFIAIVMLLSALLPFLNQSFQAVIPELFPKEVVDAYGFIQEIPAGKPVLIAVQYEAGLAGELAWASEPVIENLVSRGIPMAVVSTNVSGYAILEEQLRRAFTNDSNNQFEEKVINLGYLPGGTIGLISLVRDPREAVPFSTALEPAWESAPLENVAEISDFAAVLLLTDNPEILRAWVEQSGRAEIPPPLLAVVSAQAAPLVQPYHDSGQIRGFIAGSSGALSYQMIRQVPGKASSTFTSYQLAVLTAALLIFLGGVVTLINTAGTGIKQKGGG